MAVSETDQEYAGLVEALRSTRYRPLKALSRGAFGYVVRAAVVGSGEDVAIKAVRLGPTDDQKDILREILNHEKLLHAHVVRFKEAFAAPPYLCIAMEYVPGGDLLDYINQKRGGLAEDEARYIFQQLILAVDFCHRVGVMNRDIKPENTLLVRLPNKPPMVKLCDFGYAKSLEDSAPKTRAGTLMYVAPEVMMNIRPAVYDGMKADIWSCGVLLYVMLFCTFPFAEELGPGQPLSEAQQTHKMLRRMASGDFSFPAWKPVSLECQDLVRRMLSPDGAKRYSVEDIKRHPWFLRNLLPGTLDYNNRALAVKRIMPQSEAEIQAAIAESRGVPKQPSSTASQVAYSSLLDSDDDEEIG